MNFTTIYNFLKSKIIYLVAISALIFISFYLSCNKTSTKNVVITATGFTAPTKQEVKQYNARAVINVVPASHKIGFTPVITIVETKDNKLEQVTTQKIKFGLEHNFGIWIGGLTQLDGGISLDLIDYWRLNFGLLAGIKSSGIDLNYQVLNNTYVGVAYNYNYYLQPSPIAFIKLNF